MAIALPVVALVANSVDTSVLPYTKLVAVTAPPTITPARLAVTAEPTTTEVAVAIPKVDPPDTLISVAVTARETFTPLGNVGALEPPLSVKLSARTLPPLPERGCGAPVVPIPRMSDTKSSPSAIVKSIPDATAISGY